MKRKNLSLLFWLLLFAFQNVAAAEVEVKRAQKYAVEFMAAMGGEGFSVKETECVSKDGNAVYYIINMAPEGWVLVSAQDGVKPLLGYNMEGSYVNDPGMTNLADWMDYYCRQITDAVKYSDKPIANWDKPSRPVKTRGSNAIEPLIKVNWNQGKPYNEFCPEDEDGRAVVGCVAVGMAQAMSVARWPLKPNGTYSYNHKKYGTISINYDEADPYDWDKIIAGDDGKVWVAHLLYHCGVAVAMDYGVDGSGSQNSRVAKALVRNFGYSSNTVEYIAKDSYEGDWGQLILSEIEAGRAVVYAGIDTKGAYGHCFNLDGYDGALFHVNWGWGGSNNGYFPIEGLRDVKMNMNYDADHSVVIGVKKPTTAPLDITLSNTVLQSGLPAGTALAKVYVKSEMEGYYNFKITGPKNMITHKYATVPFKINFNQELVSTESLVDGAEYEVIITASNLEGESLPKEFELTVSSTAGVTGAVQLKPVSSEFYSLSGVKLDMREEELQPGIYIRVKTLPDGRKVSSKTIIR
ncbi:MAG: C10 family peptidase [Bacteroidaceae bacterium]|nr:C10 family peptidase [Bacteroidaceae bacterium]